MEPFETGDVLQSEGGEKSHSTLLLDMALSLCETWTFWQLGFANKVDFL